VFESALEHGEPFALATNTQRAEVVALLGVIIALLE
jgi:hypothetical protein